MTTMGVIQRGTSSVLIDLPAQQSVRTLEQALRSQTTLRLSSKADAQRTVTGTLARGTKAALAVNATGVVPHTWRSAYCDVSFELRQEVYHFTAVVLELTSAESGTRIVLSEPPCLKITQRRRFVRAAVADSAPVRIGSADDFGVNSAEGMILNVSPDGMACRVPVAVADAYAVEERVGLVFALGSGPEFRLNATIVSKTPGGTPGTIIMGLQFMAQAAVASERERLAAALQAYH